MPVALARMKSDPVLVIKWILWPLAILTLLQRLIVLVPNRAKTDDFTTVYTAAVRFLRHEPVYVENYDTVDPHYLYAPSGTLLMAPFGYFDPETARNIFVALSTIALLVALYVMLRMFGYGLNSAVTPAVLFFAVTTEAVTNTLVYTNFNLFLLLAEIVAMALLLKRKDLWAGIPLGLSFAVKPLLAVFLLLIILNRQWKALITAIGVPIVLMGIGWALAADPKSYIDRTMPYLGVARDYYNSSISGNAMYFGLPDWLTFLLKAAVLIMAAVSVYLLYRYYRSSNELLWWSTSAGVLMTAMWLVGSLGQGYYSMLLFPMLMTIVYRSSVVANWPAWLAVYGFLSYDFWLSGKWLALGRSLAYLKCTLGWTLLIVVTFCVLVYRYLDARAEGRLEYGIDRPLPPDEEPGRHERIEPVAVAPQAEPDGDGPVAPDGARG
ncbi:glycosyltransferase family 87 protein [Tsukamurella strandjordii]|uniref:Glycosyltransferase family 87 protein n=1 Tax=Tsukamurella strandjordii TaxID=147577 RepID=A0AA90SKX0_9ACTN|nr:glycosyltransferase family 87 protein [Tsukamurella strandjordii]MDP0397628.1 glycosyltransferase family 87 protein [Tsukamurella strandjordii]